MATEVIGILQLSYEWGLDLTGSVYVDSSAAIGIVKRKGNGKLSHIRVGQLWIQEKSENGELQFRKVPGEANPGDLMTKYLAEKIVLKHMNFLGQEFATGRFKKSLQL